GKVFFWVRATFFFVVGKGAAHTLFVPRRFIKLAKSGAQRANYESPRVRQTYADRVSVSAL
ncbi:MAG: hypothetical protein ACR2GW_00710, partial [Pyrinomonadaceae bacterium]